MGWLKAIRLVESFRTGINKVTADSTPEAVDFHIRQNIALSNSLAISISVTGVIANSPYNTDDVIEGIVADHSVMALIEAMTDVLTEMTVDFDHAYQVAEGKFFNVSAVVKLIKR
jgi:hypothetical protein